MTNRHTKMTEPLQLTLLHLVVSRPGIYLGEIQQEMKSQYGLDVFLLSVPA